MERESWKEKASKKKSNIRKGDEGIYPFEKTVVEGFGLELCIFGTAFERSMDKNGSFGSPVYKASWPQGIMADKWLTHHICPSLLWMREVQDSGQHLRR
jgi:hypothetical protein